MTKKQDPQAPTDNVLQELTGEETADVAVAEAGDADEIARAEREKRRLNARLATRTLLIIEDNEELQAALAEAAGEKGFKVFLAGDGQEGFRKAQNQPFDAILVDMNLPKKLGHEVVADIRLGGPCAKSVIVVLSGYLKKEVVQGLVGKIDKAFTKPADIEAVVESIRALVDARIGKKAA